MSSKPSAIDQWRKYFQRGNTDIFEVIEHAIIVAASDYPNEFKIRRDGIAEKLFACRLTRCIGCERVELAIPEEEERGVSFKSNSDGTGSGVEGVRVKESNLNSCTTNEKEMNENRGSNYSYDEAEALTEAIEEENQMIGEVLRIKQVLENCEDESSGVLYDSLRRLQLMSLSIQILQATEIGKAVNGLRKHGSMEIRHLSRSLIEGWKEIVAEWVKVSKTTRGADEPKDANCSPDSVNPSIVDEEEGLPSPPLDEGAFFTTQPTSIELSQFFDGMDDDGNPRNGGEFDKKCENGRKPVSENDYVAKRKPQAHNRSNLLKRDKSNQMTKHEIVSRQIKPANSDSTPSRPPRPSLEQKAGKETKLPRKLDTTGNQRRALSGQQDPTIKLKSSEDNFVRQKLEAAKRKLHEGYQQAENAKKQRTIQVMELQDLPKQSLGQKNLHVKSGGHSRWWSNGRH
ncbi:hypothetical protein Scep_003041 [Stephania cephalantha]|uniref:TFIIS N-terminal domain-containing protein n=1 Tax=Stephania cephalantha TaxID=152367 RepID=A0AAP0LDX1_9MAGN